MLAPAAPLRSGRKQHERSGHDQSRRGGRRDPRGQLGHPSLLHAAPPGPGRVGARAARPPPGSARWTPGLTTSACGSGETGRRSSSCTAGAAAAPSSRRSCRRSHRGAGHTVVAFDGPAHGDFARDARPPCSTSATPSARWRMAAGPVFGARRPLAWRDGGGPWPSARGSPLGRVVFLAPPAVPPRSSVASSGRSASRRGSRRHRGGLRAPRRASAGATWSCPPSPRALAVPLLVVHDRGDREVPWHDGAAIAAAWPGAALVTTEGIGHRKAVAEYAGGRARSWTS